MSTNVMILKNIPNIVFKKVHKYLFQSWNKEMFVKSLPMLQIVPEGWPNFKNIFQLLFAHILKSSENYSCMMVKWKVEYNMNIEHSQSVLKREK